MLPKDLVVNATCDGVKIINPISRTPILSSTGEKIKKIEVGEDPTILTLYNDARQQVGRIDLGNSMHIRYALSCLVTTIENAAKHKKFNVLDDILKPECANSMICNIQLAVDFLGKRLTSDGAWTYTRRANQRYGGVLLARYDAPTNAGKAERTRS